MLVPRAILITEKTATLGAELDAQRLTRLALMTTLRANGTFTADEEKRWDETVDQISKLSAQIRRMTIEGGISERSG